MPSLALHETPFFSLDAPEEQDFLVDFLISLGYKVTREGVCYGFGEMLSDDFIGGKLNAFLQRISLMHYRVQVHGSAANYFQHFEQKQKDAVKDGRLDEARAIEAELKDVRDFSKQLSESQAPFYHPELSEGRYLGQTQKLTRASKATPQALPEKSSTCETQYIPVLHTKASFAALLRRLQTDHQHAFSIMLIINNHAITVQHGSMTLHYQSGSEASNQGSWLNVDPNHLYDLAFESDVDNITQAIFKHHEHMVFGISVKMSVQHEAKVSVIESLLVTTQAPDLVASPQLLQMTCTLGDLGFVKRVIVANQTAELKLISDKQILQKMEYAAAFNHLNVVQHLLGLTLDVPEKERSCFIHSALGDALRYGACEVITYLLEQYPESLLEQNIGYHNQTILMIAATNHVSLKIALEALNVQPLANRRQVLQAVDVNKQDALFHARMNPVSFGLLLERYLSDRELQTQFKSVEALQKLLLSIMPYPVVLALFIEKISLHKRLLSVLKLAIVEALPQPLMISSDAKQSHLILAASAHYQDALAPLLSCLDEEELADHLKETVGHVFDGLGFDDTPEATRAFIEVEKLSTYMSSILKRLPELSLLDALLMFHHTRVPAILDFLSEDSLVEMLLLDSSLVSFGLHAINEGAPVVQQALTASQDEINATSVIDCIKFLGLTEPVSRLVHAKVQNPELLAQLRERAPWLDEPIKSAEEDDSQLETFKTLIPKHQAMRTWFARLEPEVRLSLFKRAGGLLCHAPNLFECIFSDLPSPEQEAFVTAMINEPRLYVRNTGLRVYRLFANILNAEQKYQLLNSLLTPDLLLSIVWFFISKKDGLALLCEGLNASHAHELLNKIIPPSGQTTLQLLLGKPDKSSWCAADLRLIAALVKPLASNQTRTLLLEHPLAVYRFRQHEPEVYELMLSRLDEEDKQAIESQYENCCIVNGKLVPQGRVTPLSIFEEEKTMENGDAVRAQQISLNILPGVR